MAGMRRYSVNVYRAELNHITGTSNSLMDSKVNVYEKQLPSSFPEVQGEQRLPNANQEGARVHKEKSRVRHEK